MIIVLKLEVDEHMKKTLQRRYGWDSPCDGIKALAIDEVRHALDVQVSAQLRDERAAESARKVNDIERKVRLRPNASKAQQQKLDKLAALVFGPGGDYCVAQTSAGEWVIDHKGVEVVREYPAVSAALELALYGRSLPSMDVRSVHAETRISEIINTKGRAL